MIKLNGHFLVVHFVIDADCAQLLEDTTACRLSYHGSLLRIVLADAVIWELNIVVNYMYNTARVDHAQDLVWCHLLTILSLLSVADLGTF